MVHLFYIFTVAHASVNSIRPEQPILRLHEGFIGLPTENFHVILDDWIHTIQINLPRKPTVNDLRSLGVELTNTVTETPYLFDKQQGRYLYDFDCTNSSHCDLTRTLSKHIVLYKYQNAYFLRSLLESFDHNVPLLHSFPLRHRRHTKSSWDRFLSWMNIGTETELGIIYKNLVNLQDAVQDGFNNFALTIDRFHSVSALLTSQAHQIDTILRKHTAAIHTLSDLLTQATTSMLNTFSAVAEYNHVHIILTELQHDFSRFIRDISPLISFLALKSTALYISFSQTSPITTYHCFYQEPLTRTLYK